MARATTKADLIASANGQFDKMWKLIDGMDKGLQEATFAEEMTTMGKEAHWSRDKICETSLFIYTNGISCY